MDPPCSHGVSRAPCYSGTPRFPSDVLQDCHLLWFDFPADSHIIRSPCRCPNPGPKSGLGCSAFARRYLRNRVCFLFLWLLRCFSSPGSLSYRMHSGTSDPQKWAGFPHSETFGSLPDYRLPEAYRRFPRPSSPLNAETSTTCPYWPGQPPVPRRLERLPVEDRTMMSQLHLRKNQVIF